MIYLYHTYIYIYISIYTWSQFPVQQEANPFEIYGHGVSGYHLALWTQEHVEGEGAHA